MGSVCCGGKIEPLSPVPEPVSPTVASRVETPILPVPEPVSPTVVSRVETPISPVPKPISPTVVSRVETPVLSVTPEYEEPRIKSPPKKRKYSAKSPFTNIGISISNPMKLIEGYQDEPLVSLEEALQTFDDEIDQLSYYIKEAKKKFPYPSKHNLSSDESAAIYIYTIKWGHGCLYDRLQEAWKSEDPSELKPWFKYLRLFKSAFDKLPDAKTEIWQGELFDETLTEKLSSNSLYSSMCICSSSEKEVKEYLEKDGVKQMLIVGYKNVNGKLMTDYTAGNSKQVLVFPGPKVGVSNWEMYGTNDLLIVHLTGPTSKYHCC
jgi:hypothetical protein